MHPSSATCPVSVVIAFGNHETSLSDCLESILACEVVDEVMLFNTGSSDHSTEVAKSYQAAYPKVKISQQTYRNIGAARNCGIKMSKGEYILFISPSDQIMIDSLGKLYGKAVEARADIIGGGVISNSGPIQPMAPDSLINKSVSGSECFIALMKSYGYIPKSNGHLFRKDFLNKCDLLFDENTLNPDELWMQSALNFAEKVCLTDIGFYFLRPEKPQIDDVDKEGPEYARNLLYIGDALFKLAEHYSFNKNESTLKSWTYVNGLRIYAAAFRIVTALRTRSAFNLPCHRMHTFKDVREHIVPEAVSRCESYYSRASAFENEYLVWRENPCDPIISDMTEQQLRDKRIVLVYNSPAWQDYTNALENLSSKYVLTLDRKYKDQAYAIVFYMPGLNEHIYTELDKPEGQIWIRWNMEPETKFIWMLNKELDDLFDLRMDYHAFADVVCPYYAQFKPGKVQQDICPDTRQNKVCMLISSGVNQSKREEYITELMQHTNVDSYGRLLKNASMPSEDKGWESKINLYRQYKFVVAFENSVLEDYVTEKLYDPLLAGAVPIYLGAPNVEDYVPGENCLINASDFPSARELADHINQCYQDDQEYMRYHQWRGRPWNEDFVRKVNLLDDSPFIRLCRLLDKY